MYRTAKNFFVLILLTTVFIGCTNQSGAISSVTTFLRVTEKDYSDDYKEKWIVGYNSSANKVDEVRIMIDDVRVWNLIEVNKEYFVSYQGSKKGGYVLGQIEHVGDENTLR